MSQRLGWRESALPCSVLARICGSRFRGHEGTPTGAVAPESSIGLLGEVNDTLVPVSTYVTVIFLESLVSTWLYIRHLYQLLKLCAFGSA